MSQIVLQIIKNNVLYACEVHYCSAIRLIRKMDTKKIQKLAEIDCGYIILDIDQRVVFDSQECFDIMEVLPSDFSLVRGNL